MGLAGSHGILPAADFLRAVRAATGSAAFREVPTLLWLNSSDKHFAYRLSDRDGKISGEFVERHDDGGMQAPSEPIRFELARTADSVAGVMRTTGAAPSGRVCPVEYGFRLTDCKAASVQAVVETSAVIDDECKRKLAEDGGQIPAELTEFRFERAQQGP